MKTFITLLLCLITSPLFATGFPEYYYEIKEKKRQHEEFGKILMPFIKKANKTILTDREFVKSFFNKALTKGLRDVSLGELKRLVRLKKRYRIKNLYDRKSYLERIDKIPISLAIAQAAVESGWGTSRFVKLANNIFGHWTWGDKGIIPLNREEGKTHKIRIFDSLSDSVEAYMLNLNRHNAYQEFRKQREFFRKTNKKFNGLEAAKTMLYYSELREKYVEMLQDSMRKNNFLYYDAD